MVVTSCTYLLGFVFIMLANNVALIFIGRSAQTLVTGRDSYVVSFSDF